MHHALSFSVPLVPSPLPLSHCFTSPSSAPPRRPRPLSMVLPNPRLHSPSPSARSDPLTSTLSDVRASPLMLCIREDNHSIALSAASAALRGGIRCVEVTLTTPSAPSLIRTLSAAFPSACIGAGTVLTLDDVSAVAAAGARFALSPVTDAALIPAIHDAGMLAVPGAATPTEIHAAHVAGARLVKIFPVGLLGGLDFVKAVQGPLGHIPLLPTNGVDEQALRDYLLQSNVYCVGAGREILRNDAVRNGDWLAIEKRARLWAGIAHECAALRNVER